MDFSFEVAYPNELSVWSAGEKVTGQAKIDTDLELRSDDGQSIFSIPRPLIYEQNYPLEQVLGYFEVEETAYGLEMVLKAPLDWLMDPVREYPVVVDPGISILNTTTTVKCVSLWYLTGKSYTSIYTGFISGEEMYALFEFNLSSIPPFSTIMDGTIDLFCNYYSFSHKH